MTSALVALRRDYAGYVDTFRNGQGELPAMMQLKLEHTAGVVGAARLIAQGEGFDETDARCAEAAALLHDTGRYEQLLRYNPVRDGDSVDHAVVSYVIVRSKGWLAAGPAREREAVLEAVRMHNRRELPAGLAGLELKCACAVRDADKLDIFRVLEERIKSTDWRHDARAFWNLPVNLPPDQEVVAAIRDGRPVDYQYIKSLADFVLVQVGWIRSGLVYATSRRLCRDRGHLEFRRRFLREIGAPPAADELCALVDAEAEREFSL